MSEAYDTDVAFTVVIPTFNRMRTVRTAIESVLSQRHERFTLVVVDDGSTDATSDVLATYDDERLVMVRQENMGVCVARNRGVGEASEPYLTFLDSDDAAEASWLETFAEMLARGGDLVSVGVRYVDDFGAERIRRPDTYGPSRAGMEALFLTGAFAISRSAYDAVGGYAPGLRFSENTDLSIRLARRFGPGGLRTATSDVALVRVHDARRPYDPERRYESALQILDAHGDHLKETEPHLFATYAAIASTAAHRLGRRRSSLRWAVRAISAEPSRPRHFLRAVRALGPRGAAS